jgi:hypothetical protein
MIRLFAWCWKLGIGVGMGGSFAAGDEGIYGPYSLWFDQKFFIFYWAVSPPYKLIGFRKFAF